MPFALQLFFDAASDTAVRNVWEAFASTGVPYPLRDSGNRPHVSLASYAELNTAVCAGRLKSLAHTLAPFALSIASLGIFPGEQTVVFLAPIVSSSLLDLHMQVHQLLKNIGTLAAAYYLPGHWTPHCTLAMPVPLLSQAVAIGLGISFPLPLTVEEIGLIEYPPVNHLCSFRLTGG